jgi:hypothetical protein
MYSGLADVPAVPVLVPEYDQVTVKFGMKPEVEETFGLAIKFSLRMPDPFPSKCTGGSVIKVMLGFEQIPLIVRSPTKFVGL